MKLNPEMIKSLPALMGESDVLKAIQLQPGHATREEHQVSVRGGSNDQNCFCLMEYLCTINHLFGFLVLAVCHQCATYIKAQCRHAMAGCRR